MAATENSGVFDVGTFDNASFDTIEQPSTVNVFSQQNISKTLNKALTSTVNVFSSLGREITRDLSSFVTPIQSQIDAQKQILRNIQSFATVFSEADFRIGKKVVSTLKTVSQNDRTSSLFRSPVSTIKAVSKNRVIFELVNVSKIKMVSENGFDRIFNRFTQSTLKIQSEIKDILRSAPDISPPFTVEIKQSFQTFVGLKQSFQTFVNDKT